MQNHVFLRERGLEKFNPLARIITYDDFDLGFNGWMDLTPNFVYPDYQQAPGPIDVARWAPTMLSSAPMRFASSHGSMEGTYSLKLSTRPVASRWEEPVVPGSMGCAIKRLSRFGNPNKLQIEAWYTYTPQQDREGLGEEDIRAFGFYFDVQDSEYRYKPGVRYVNSINGKLVKKWQYWKVTENVTTKEWCGLEDGWYLPGIDNHFYGRRYPDGSSDGYQWVPDGAQELVYNESPDKLNWNYFRLVIDYNKREYIELQSQDRIFDLRGIAPTATPRYKGIDNLINPIFYIETDTNRSVNLFLDSVVYSIE